MESDDQLRGGRAWSAEERLAGTVVVLLIVGITALGLVAAFLL